MASPAESVRYRFGRFELQPGERRLLADGEPVRLGGHAFDLLVLLVERNGHLVGKDELMTHVWQRVVVEENTLQSHIAALRKVLGTGAIATVSGKGYRFAAEVERLDGEVPTSVRPRKVSFPLQLTSFIGREQEIARIGRLMSGTRLLTLVGAGGCGKTRLALKVVEHVLDGYEDGGCFVELAPLSDPTLVVQLVANALSIEGRAGGDLSETVVECLESRHLLLMLDNAEHLLDASAGFVEKVLRRCSRLVILVTSRERLGISGELTYRVPSLSVPSEGQDLGASGAGVLSCEAARLFVERARLHRPDFEITPSAAAPLAAICRRLDGIALAIELAAPRLRSMSIDELCRRLDHRFTLLTEGARTAPARHRTLRSMIDWSYDLLGDIEKMVFRRACAFAGGWTLEAAERICSDRIMEPEKVLDVLTSLVDKNLVLATVDGRETRFGVLETLRHYGQEQLQRSGEAPAVLTRHLEYFLELAENLAEQQQDEERQAKLVRLDPEHDNLRVALAWSAETASASARGLRLAGKLYWFWRARGFYTEGRDWVYRLLAASSSDAPEKDRATAFTTLGVLVALQSDYRRAEQHWEEALVVRRRLGERRHVAALLRNIAAMCLITKEAHQHARARALYEEALSICRELGDRRDIGHTLYCIAIQSVTEHDYRGARAQLEESLSIRRESGVWNAAETLAELGRVEYMLGDLQSARARLTEALAGEREFGHRQGIARALVWLGIVSHVDGDLPSARAQLAEALDILPLIGDRQTLATALDAVGGLCLESPSATDSARLWGYAQRLREAFDGIRTEYEEERYERMLATARETMSAVEFDRAWEDGQTLAVDGALRLALTHLKQP
jgi:non-specific serine/threonine protein kinase